MVRTKTEIASVSKESLNAYCGRLNMELLEALKLDRFEEASLIQKKLNAAEAVRLQKEELQSKLDRAVEAGLFDEAQEIKQSIKRIVDDFLRFKH